MVDIPDLWATTATAFITSVTGNIT